MSVGTLPTDEVLEDYWQVFVMVYAQEPKVHYLGNQWYQVNGEPVHRTIMIREIDRLRDLAQLQRMNQKRTQLKEKSAVQRLIDRLRRV